MFPKLLILLDGSQRRRLMLVLAGTLMAGVLEMVGIGAIPAFVGLLVEPIRLIGTLPVSAPTNWIRQTPQATLILYAAGLLAGFFLLKNFYLGVLIYVETRLMAEVTASVSNRLFRAYLYSSYTFHLQRNPAEFVRNLTDESVHSIEFIKAGMRLLREGLVLTVVFILLMLVDPVVSFSVLALLASATGCFYLIVRRALTRRSQLSRKHWNRQIQIINQAMGGIKHAKIMGREPHLIKLFGLEVSRSRAHDTFYLVVSAMPKLFLEVVAVAALLLVGVAFVLFDRPMQTMLPVLTLLGVAVVRLVPAAIFINLALADIRYKRPAFDLVCAELKDLESSIAKQRRIDLTQSKANRLHDVIRVDNIHYRYPDAPVEALRGVSLEICAGEAVAFIGSSGAGKSTLVDIILGLLTPTSGQVSVDGRDIQKNLPVWQRQIGYIPQDVYLNDDSIRRNIAFGLSDDEISEIALSRALQAAQLEPFVRDLPEGLETLIGNRGIRLSGGQRQRIGIARALYHDPAVLVMDEATSALDNETEHEVIDAISRLRRDRTIVMVAHNLTTVRACDKIYLLEGGKLKEGVFDEVAVRHIVSYE